MRYIPRLLDPKLQAVLRRGKSVLLLGPRQTGKTTLLSSTLRGDLSLSFVRPDVRLRYEKNPGLLASEVEALPRATPAAALPLVLLDEVQRIPPLLDVVQDLIDRKMARFVLTGSSARKLKRGPSVNLLPGRIVPLRLDPFVLSEMRAPALETLLLDGSLPGILSQEDPAAREEDLLAYVTTYLDEEIRSEAIVRRLAAFARFLEHAAAESGRLVSFRKLSQEVGVAHTTIAAYYEVLEDCLVAERVDPITESRARARLTKSSKYLLFDAGVRRALAREGRRLPAETMGHLFEQWAGLELIRLSRLAKTAFQVRFWRDPAGPEVDWVLEQEGVYVPVEVKWKDAPVPQDARHLQLFMSEYPSAERGYLICRTPRRLQLAPRVEALPWQEIGQTAPGS